MLSKFIKAIINRFRSLLGKAADTMNDPVANADLAIHDSINYINDFRNKIATAMAEIKNLEKKATEAQQKAENYKVVAQKAASDGKEDVARQALTKSLSFSKEAAALNSEKKNLDSIVVTLRAQLEQAEKQIEKAKSSKTILETRQIGNEVREGLANLQNEYGDKSNPLARLNELEEHVNKEAGRLDALEELSGSNDGLAQYEASLGDAEVEAQLAELMSKSKKETEVTV